MSSFKELVPFLLLLSLANIIAYGSTIFISKKWDKIHKHQSSPTKIEILDSLIILLINIIIGIPGFFLWKIDVIVFSDDNIFLSFTELFLLIDFSMYLLHWVSHNFSPFKKIHSKHHEHSEEFNCVSLYYMSPWESIFFGLLLTFVVAIFQFNMYGFILFLIFNWIYGVITHLNTKTHQSTFLIFTTNMFHRKHHQLNYKNYGFYTFFWDKLFRTENRD